jgi:hypothetical protein
VTAVTSRFRPWLDHLGLDHLGLDSPGAWPEWTFDAAERAGFAAVLAAGGALAAERLTNLYGEQAESSGALALIAALAATPPPARDLQAAACAIAACDHHRARLAGRWTPRRRQRLRAYLVGRTLAMLRENAADALLWRAIFARVADDFAPVAQLTRSLHQELSASGLFGEVAVTLELNPPVAGGGRWVALQSRFALAELRRRLAAREPCLVELIRDAENDPPAVDLVVAWRLEDELNLGRDGVERVRLWIYDPRGGGTASSLRLTLADDGVQAVELPAGAGRSSVKALRLVRLAPGDPPAEGWRCWLKPAHPWGFLWWLQRQALLFAGRGRD